MINIIDVTQSPYFAAGDGTTDDTTAIQDALDAAKAAQDGTIQPPIVYLPRGKYLVGRLHFCATAIILRGDGRYKTWLKRKCDTDDPVLDIGGLDASHICNNVELNDFSIEGNAEGQGATTSLVRMRRCDRSKISGFSLEGSNGNGLEIGQSTVTLRHCEILGAGNGSDGIGVLWNGCNDSLVDDCLIHGWGLQGQYFMFDSGGYTGDPVLNLQVSDPKDMSVYTVGGFIGDNGVSITSTDAYEMLIDGVANIFIGPNVGIYTISNGGANPNAGAIGCINGAWNNRIVGLWWRANDPFSDPASHDCPPGGNESGRVPFLTFDETTHDNVYGWNQQSVMSVGPSGQPVALRTMNIDSGHNYEVGGPNEVSLRSIARGSGGHPLVGWQSEPVTNFALHSEDLEDEVWVSDDPCGVVTTISSDAYAGTPVDPAGTATYVQYGAGSGVHTLTQTVDGLSLEAGQLVTFSVYALLASSGDVDADVQLRLVDDGGAVLDNEVPVAVRLLPKLQWQRPSVTWRIPVGTETMSEIGIQIYHFVKNAEYYFYFWGAMFSIGDLAPYVPTVADPVTTQPGAVAQRLTLTKAMALASGFPTQMTVGSAGGASSLPATPAGYHSIWVDGIEYVIPYYAKS